MFVSTTRERLYDDNINSFEIPAGEDPNYGGQFVNIYKPEHKKAIFCIVWGGYVQKKNAAKESQGACQPGNERDALVNKEKAYKVMANTVYGGLNGPFIRMSFGPFAALLTYRC